MSMVTYIIVILLITGLSIWLNVEGLGDKTIRLVPGLIGSFGTAYYIHILGYSYWHVGLHVFLIVVLTVVIRIFLIYRLTKRV